MESERLNQEWEKICTQIKTYSEIDIAQINAFFSRLEPQALSEGFLMITADTDFIKTWVERHYINYISQALKDLYGIDYVIAIEVDTTQQTRKVQQTQITTDQAFTQPIKQEQSIQQAQQITNTTYSDPIQVSGFKQSSQPQIMSDFSNNKSEITSPVITPTSSLTFENYVVGASNRMAYSMAIAVAEAPGQSPALNPLFIYGKSGLGKTHLLRAIQNYIARELPHLNTVYVDSAQLLDDYMDAATTHDKEKQSYKNFKTRYEGADVLLIDDVQYLQGKKQTLEIVFQIFNNLTSQGKQVILSADRAPKNIDIDERYSSRFNSGGTFDIQPPEFEVKLGIIKNLIEEYKRLSNLPEMVISDDIQRYIAENSSSNIRELKSAVTKVIFEVTTFNKTNISLGEVKEILKNHFTGGSLKKLTVADIQKQVELYYKVNHADLIGKKRSRNIAYARQIATYLCRHMLDVPYSYIGKFFGNRDHTTIMYSVTNIEEKMKENLEIEEELESIKQMIREA